MKNIFEESNQQNIQPIQQFQPQIQPNFTPMSNPIYSQPSQPQYHQNILAPQPSYGLHKQDLYNLNKQVNYSGQQINQPRIDNSFTSANQSNRPQDPRMQTSFTSKPAQRSSFNIYAPQLQAAGGSSGDSHNRPMFSMHARPLLLTHRQAGA